MHAHDSCEMCCGMRGHMRIKNTMCAEFERDFLAAQMECQRLKSLFHDVCWYNFESKCRTWRSPWPTSLPDSYIELCGVSIEICKRHGREREIGHFPIYYAGSVEDAPPLPPKIVLNELTLAEHSVLRHMIGHLVVVSTTSSYSPQVCQQNCKRSVSKPRLP